MKQKLFTMLTAIIFIISVFGCSLFSNSENKHEIAITVETPEQSAAALQSRSAIPELPADQINYKIMAVQGEKTVISTTPLESNQNKFILEITSGTWIISVYGFPSEADPAMADETEAIFYGQKTLFVKDSGEYSAVIPIYYIKNGNGNVCLSIDVKETKISKLTIGGTGSSLDGDYFIDENKFINISAKEIPGETYSAVLTFYENTGTTDNPEFIKVISIQEKINVRQNVITNQWIKAGNTIYLQSREDNYADFILTDEIITDIVNTSFYVSSSNEAENKIEAEFSPSDSNSGSWADPFETIQAAANRIAVLSHAGKNQIPYTIYIDGPLENQNCLLKNCSDDNNKIDITILPYKTLDGETSASVSGSASSPLFSINNNFCLQIKDLKMSDGDIMVSNGGQLILSGDTKLSHGNIRLLDDSVLEVNEINITQTENSSENLTAKILVENPIENVTVIKGYNNVDLSENLIQKFQLKNPGYYLALSDEKTGIIKASFAMIQLPELKESYVSLTAFNGNQEEIQNTPDGFVITQNLTANPPVTAENTVFYASVQTTSQREENENASFISSNQIRLKLFSENIPVVTENSELEDGITKCLTIPENFLFQGKYILQIEYEQNDVTYDTKQLVTIL